MDEIFSLSDGMGTFLYTYQDEEEYIIKRR